MKTKDLIVRSSAIDEDKFGKANAGCYHTEMNVKSNKIELKKAIDRVFMSYKNNNQQDEVLIRPQLKRVKASGVIFTRTLETGAPYLLINYTEGTDTTAITSGLTKRNHKIYISRFAPESVVSGLPKLWISLLEGVKEIESLVCHDALDIEFAVSNKEEIITLQVRPLMGQRCIFRSRDRY